MVSSERRWLLSIAALAFLLRLGYAASSGSLRDPQVWETETIATNLLEHHAFLYEHDGTTYRAYAEPMYPFIAAAVYLVTGHSRAAMVLLQIVISTITVWLTARLAGTVTADSSAEAFAALLMAIHPGFIRYSSILHPLIFDAFFFVAAAAAILRYRHSPTLRNALVASAVIGLGAMTRPTILLFLLPLGWMAWRSGWQRTAAVVVAALAMMAPWTIRNAVVLHGFALTRSGTGFVLWLGNNPNTTGSATDADGRPLLLAAPPEFQARVRAADELTRDRIFREAARDTILANPGAAAVRVARRFLFFWWFSPQWGRNYPPLAKAVYRIWWAGVLLLCAIGAFLSWRLAPQQRHDVWLLVAMAVLVSIGQSLFYVEGRHRLAVEPLILPLAALTARLQRDSGGARRAIMSPRTP